MAEVMFDRVTETTGLVGTGPVTLTGSVLGYRTFASVMAVGDTTRFVIQDPSGPWEVVAGTYTGTNTLSRATVEASSNGGAKVNFAGTPGTVVFMDETATLLSLLAPKLNPVLAGTASVGAPPVGSVQLTQGTASNTGYVAFFDAANNRQGYIGFATNLINMNAEGAATGWNMVGTFAVSGAIVGYGSATFSNNLLLVDNDTTGQNLTAVQILAGGNPSGANIKMFGNGSFAPSKYIRVQGGEFHVINNAYSAILLSLTDAGNLRIAGTFDQLTAETNRAVAAEAGLNTRLSTLTGRNLIQNAQFRINQRGAGMVSAGYPFDRWYLGNGGGGSRSASRYFLGDNERAAIGDEDARSGLSDTVTGGSGANDYEILVQAIESVTTLAGKTATLSFWANVPAGLKVGIELLQLFGSGGSPSGVVSGIGSQSFTGTGAWKRYVSTPIAVPSLNGKSIGTVGGDNLQLYFWLSGGTTFSARSGGIGVQSGQFLFWGVQLEVGAAATPLEKPTLNFDLSQCQRYYQLIAGFLVPGYAASGAPIYCDIALPVPMRATPSVSISNASYSNANSLALNGAYFNHVRLQAIIAATGAGYAIGDILMSADL